MRNPCLRAPTDSARPAHVLIRLHNRNRRARPSGVMEKEEHMSNPVIGTPWKKLNGSVSTESLSGVEKYWRCANYLSVGQIYLRSNPLMKKDWVDEKTGEVRDFGRKDVKHRLVGHWGTTPGINFLFGHVNRLIADHQQNTVFLMGPGHGGPAGTAQSLLDGTYREIRPDITDDEAGLQKFFRQFSYPGGIPRPPAPSTRAASSATRCLMPTAP